MGTKQPDVLLCYDTKLLHKEKHTHFPREPFSKSCGIQLWTETGVLEEEENGGEGS